MNYVEPFFGSGAVLLARPGGAAGIETVNDKDGYVCNVWRALQIAPDEVAMWANGPAYECDLHARHVWLRAQQGAIVSSLEGDPHWYDAKIAGWWLWGIAQWIGGGFCGPSGSGPWGVVNGQLMHLDKTGQGISRKRPGLGSRGHGVTRKLVHLGDGGQGVTRQLVHLGSSGQGVTRRGEHLGESDGGLVAWFRALQTRLRLVRVCCGDWMRVLGPSPTVKLGVTGVFLDPPYGKATGRSMHLYAQDDSDVAQAVAAWAIAHGDDPHFRIILCGYEGEHQMPPRWTVIPWKAKGGYASLTSNGHMNARRERLWASPFCQEPLPLFMNAEH